MPTPPVEMTDAEKLTLLMLCEIHKALKIKDGVDASFVEHTIYNGNTWALRWQMPGIFDVTETPSGIVTATVDYLDMWDAIERSYKNLSKADKAWLEKEVQYLGKNPKFNGFDGNSESEYIGVARTLIEKMGRWSNFKDRDLDSHVPMSVDGMARMYAVYESKRLTLGERWLSREELADILKARIHPTMRDKQAS